MNDYAMVVPPVAAVIVFLVLLKVLPWSSGRKEEGRKPNEVGEIGDLSPIAASTTQGPQLTHVEIEAKPLVVRHLNAGNATLMVRHRPRMKGCTAHLVIWSGKKKRRIEDSYYDLGVIKADGIGDDIVEEFLRLAREKIGGLTASGKRKLRQKKKSTAKATTETSSEAPAQSQVGQPAENDAVTVEEDRKSAIKMKRFPSVYRGVVLEMGMMPRAVNGREIACFGVRYQTAEGVVGVVWGTQLRTALRDAKAGPGDEVEIIKVGRQILEEGKAPMNLYRVARIKQAA